MQKGLNWSVVRYIIRELARSLRDLIVLPKRGHYHLRSVLLSISEYMKLVRHNSQQVQCLYCGWIGNRFFPNFDYVSGKKKYAMCPNCRSDDRYRLYLAYLQKRTPFFGVGGWRILDIAPPPYFIKYLQSSTAFSSTSRYLSLDLRMPHVQVWGDLTKLCFRNNSFDFIICSHVLEHVPSDIDAMRELVRVMKPGAKGILQVPLWDGLVQTIEYGRPMPDEYEHYRRYGLDYANRLLDVGFMLEIDDFALHADPSWCNRYGIKTESLYIVTCP